MTKLIRQILGLWLALFAALATTPAVSANSYMSDIDIYGFTNTNTEQPNVLIVLDNTANWSTMFTREIASMINVFNALPSNRFRVGLMMYTESGAGGGTSGKGGSCPNSTGNTGDDGGYVRAAIRPLSDSYKTTLGSMLGTLDVNCDKSNAGKSARTMAEAYLYFAGKDAVTGNNKTKTDYAGNVLSGNTTATQASNAVYALSGNALTSKAGPTYTSPIANSCVSNYIIFVSNGPAQDPSSDNTTASNQLSAAYTALNMARPADITGLTPNASESNVSDEWARFMKASPQAVSTYTLDIDPATNGTQGPGWTALLKSIAVRSGGEYFKIDSTVNNGEQIVNALNNIFNQIDAANSVFASASLPVSVNARGTYLNQVFMGMFRPDASSKPRWRGNVKQYNFGYDPATDTLSLVDTQGNPAITGTTGFISPTAVSYWTQPSSYWVNQQQGTPPSSSDSPDGEVVEKGGVAEGLRTKYATSQDGRKVYTCTTCSNTDLTATSSQFVTTNSALTPDLFKPVGASSTPSTTETTNIIKWTRGENNVDSTTSTGAVELGPGGTTTVRPSIHGDVLHSRPAVVNYGPNQGVVVFYGSNDGLLRAVNGNQTGTGAGDEMWAFLPSEQLPKLKRLRDNSPEVRLSMTQFSTSTTVVPTPRDYFVDGPIGVYQKVNSTGGSDKVYIYPGMRRGGRVFYALDVTNLSAPKVMWKKTPTDVPVLGQTWSEPRVARIKGNSNPVIIMGAGYDAGDGVNNFGEDEATPGAVTMGNAVLVFDAFTGELLRQFNTTRSVAADVSVIDADYDGYVDRAYAADTGGNVYRIDFELTDGTTLRSAKTDWRMFQLAALSTNSATRKVFFAPDVVFSGQTTAVLVGTGDREKPLTYSTQDAFFTLYDKVPARGAVPTGFTAYTPSNLAVVGTGADTTNGCYIPMGTNGEKIINAPVTVGGNTYFSTNTPTPANTNSCNANLGTAKVYAAPLFCRAASMEVRKGGGMPPTAVSGVVTVTYTRTNPDGTTSQVTKQVPFLIGGTAATDDPGGCNKSSGIEGCKIKLTVPPTRVRKYWYTEKRR